MIRKSYILLICLLTVMGCATGNMTRIREMHGPPANLKDVHDLKSFSIKPPTGGDEWRVSTNSNSISFKNIIKADCCDFISIDISYEILPARISEEDEKRFMNNELRKRIDKRIRIDEPIKMDHFTSEYQYVTDKPDEKMLEGRRFYALQYRKKWSFHMLLARKMRYSDTLIYSRISSDRNGLYTFSLTRSYVGSFKETADFSDEYLRLFVAVIRGVKEKSKGVAEEHLDRGLWATDEFLWAVNKDYGIYLWLKKEGYLKGDILYDPDFDEVNSKSNISEIKELREIAIKSLEEALKYNLKSSDLVKIYYYLGFLYEYLDDGRRYPKGFDASKAIFYYKKALEIDPYRSEIFFNIGYIEKVLGRYDTAISEIKMAMELNPQNYVYLYELGFFYSQVGRKNKAKEILENALYLCNEHLKSLKKNKIKSTGYEWAKGHTYAYGPENTMIKIKKAMDEIKSGER